MFACGLFLTHAWIFVLHFLWIRPCFGKRMSKFSEKVSAVDVYFSLLTANWFAIVTFPLGETSGTRTVSGAV